MKKMFSLCAAGVLLMGAGLSAQAEDPGSATLIANDCLNLQVLRQGQPLQATLGMQLRQGDQVICGDGTFAVGYPNCGLESLQQHVVNTAACSTAKTSGAYKAAAADPGTFPSVEQAGIGAAVAIGVGGAFAAGLSDDDDGPFFPIGFSPATAQ